MLCYNCAHFGHTKLRCKQGQVSHYCGVPAHSECASPAVCIHCKGNHNSLDLQCRAIQIVFARLYYDEARKEEQDRKESGDSNSDSVESKRTRNVEVLVNEEVMSEQSYESSDGSSSETNSQEKTPEFQEARRLHPPPLLRDVHLHLLQYQLENYPQ
uniref:CCHC-type domain-containing protein n=1 Tax=Anopheles farauti TaxID=69004 RepID=A0A182Q1Y0_9DIPT